MTTVLKQKGCAMVLRSTLVIAAMTLVESTPPAAASRVTDVGVADRSNAYASIATSGRFAAMAWGATKDGMTDVYLATSHDDGQTFGAPTRVNSGSEHANFSPEQPPRVALVPRPGGQPAVAVVWTSKGDTGTRLFSARSEDGGKTFKPASVVPGTDASGNRGWESVATKNDGALVALWLDHRDLAPKAGSAPMNHAEHQHVTSGENKTDGVARAQLSQLFFANLTADSSSRSLARGVCYCCKTAMTTDTTGGIYTAWRQVYSGNVRDIAFSKSSDGGRTFSTPVRVSDDNWVLDGCPENGPAIVVDTAHRIHVVWPTLLPGSTASSLPTLGLFYATSDDGRRFRARQPIPTQGVPRHVQIAATARGQLVIAWDEQSPGSRIVAIARGTIDRNGSTRFSREAIPDDRPGSYPIVGATDSGAVVGWTSGDSGQSVIRTTRLMDASENR
jgi:hypothetical protein